MGSTRHRVGMIGMIGLGACTGETPTLLPAAPEASKVTVFYPLNGLVRGRGLAGAMGPGTPFVAIDPLPDGIAKVVEVAPDGGFDFAIDADSGTVLSFAGVQSDAPGQPRGAALFIEVPPGFKAGEPWVCCLPASTCQPLGAGACSTDVLAIACTVDADCGILEGEALVLDPETFELTAPSDQGSISIKTRPGRALPADALVTFENRGLAGIGEPRPAGGVSYRFADDQGVLAPLTLSARGDDEIVIQVLMRNGYRSSPIGLTVPDAPFGGIDIVGVLPAEPLTSNQRGRVSVFVSPHGIDGRGLCPDSDEHPTTCYSGGLTHGPSGMVQLVEANTTIDDLPVAPRVPDAPLGGLRGADGDVRGPPLAIVVAIDLSTACRDAAGGDPANRRVTDVVGLVRALGRRHKVRVIAFGAAEDESEGGIRKLGSGFVSPDASELEPAISALGELTPGSSATLLDAAKAAGDLLVAERDGRVILVGNAMPPSGVSADDALHVLLPDAGSIRTVDLVGIGLEPTDLTSELKTILDFTQGELLPTAVADLPFALTHAAIRVSGAFILVFEVAIPNGSGKTPPMEVAIEARIGGTLLTSPIWSGPLFVENAQ